MKKKETQSGSDRSAEVESSSAFQTLSDSSHSSSDLNRIIGDVCNVFKDVVGAEADQKKEAQAIVFWTKKGWSTRDFRLYFEREWSLESTRNYYISNARMRLSHFLSTAENSIPIIEEKIEMLRQIEKVKRKLEERKHQKHPNDDGAMKERKYCCTCGRFINLRFIKELDEDGKSFRWQVCNRDEYERHYEEALWSGWKCLWPDAFKAKHFNEGYLSKLRETKSNPSMFFKIMESLNFS